MPNNEVSNRIIKLRLTENQLRVIIGALGLTAVQNPNIVMHGCAGGILDKNDEYLDHCNPGKMVEMLDQGREELRQIDLLHEIDLTPVR